MSGEHFKPTPETQQGLTPHERLEKFLEGQEAGSARIQAIADKVAVDEVNRRISATISQRRSPLGESLPPEPDYTKDPFLADLIEAAVIRETMRKRSFGVNGAEYNAALYEASHILDDYYNHSYNQIRKDSKSTSVDEISAIASDKLLSNF
jgi:hypothetical protein